MQLVKLDIFNDIQQARRGGTLGWDPEVRDLIKQEEPHYSGWEQLEPLPKIEDALTRREVARRNIVCPMCGFDAAETYEAPTVYLRSRGKVTGVEALVGHPCQCRLMNYFERMWSQVPALYYDISLPKLTGSTKPEFKYSMLRLIEQARKQPGRSYLIFGPPGVGKTSVAIALMRYAYQCRAWKMFQTLNFSHPPSIWRISASKLFAEHHEYVRAGNNPTYDPGTGTLAEVFQPTVSVTAIKNAVRAGFRPCLYLEELDKIPNLTEFRLSVLFDVINAIYEAEGQIVITSNSNPSLMRELLGNALYRRITREDEPVPTTTTPITKLPTVVCEIVTDASLRHQVNNGLPKSPQELLDELGHKRAKIVVDEPIEAEVGVTLPSEASTLPEPPKPVTRSRRQPQTTLFKPQGVSRVGVKSKLSK